MKVNSIEIGNSSLEQGCQASRYKFPQTILRLGCPSEIALIWTPSRVTANVH